MQSATLGNAALVLAGIANLFGAIAWCALKWEATGHGTIPGSGAAFMFGMSTALATVVVLVIAMLIRRMGKAGVIAAILLAIYLLITWHTFFRLVWFK